MFRKVVISYNFTGVIYMDIMWMMFFRVVLNDSFGFFRVNRGIFNLGREVFFEEVIIELGIEGRRDIK